MIENFTYKGTWFLPSSKEDRIYGELTFDINKGATLELAGCFKDINVLRFQTFDTILGITSDSKEITLHKCSLIKCGGITLKVGQECGTPSTIYSIQRILDGAHIETNEQFKFIKVVAEIQNLDEWINISGFRSMSFEELQEQPYKNEMTIYYKLPDTINFKLSKNIDCSFNFTLKTQGLYYFQKKCELEQRVRFILDSKVEMELESVLQYISHFRNFLIFALYRNTHISSIVLYNKERFSYNQGDGVFNQKKIILHIPFSNYDTIEPLLDREMLFSYHSIKNEFPNIIKNWFEKYNLLKPVFNLIFEQFYRAGRFNENDFLNLAQAAETFHARTCNHPKKPKDEYDIMKKEILKVIPKEYQEWIKPQFNFGNELNLQDRLTEIVTKCSNPIIDNIIKDKDSFIKQVKCSRNYYTHYSDKKKKNVLEGSELFYLSQKLKLIMVCTLLIEIGFSPELMTKLLQNIKHKFFILERN